MTKALRVLGVASLLMMAVATAMAAGGEGGGVGSRAATGTQTGSQQTNIPATGSAPEATSKQAGPTYPGTVGPTGSTQPDATNPSRSAPSGGGKN